MTVSAVLDAIVVDEIGIESGSIDGCLLKSAYQPVFELAGDSLELAAFDAVTQVQDLGLALAPLRSVPRPPDPAFITRLCQNLHLNNWRNLAMDGCDLFLDHALADNRHLHETLVNAALYAQSVGEQALEANHLVCRITDAAVLTYAASLRLLEELREAGIRIMLDAFDHDLGSAYGRFSFRPDIAEISGSWFAKIAARGAAAQMLSPLVEAHRMDGTRVLIRGIMNADQLQLALAAGADYLSGDHLGEAALVGTSVDNEPRPLAGLLEPRSASFRRPA